MYSIPSIECEGIIAHGITFVSNYVQKIIIIIKAGFLVIIMYEKVINRPNLDQLFSHGFAIICFDDFLWKP